MIAFEAIFKFFKRVNKKIIRARINKRKNAIKKLKTIQSKEKVKPKRLANFRSQKRKRRRRLK